ncbi:hypothetical protein IFT92_20085 [Peribacillus simplex]|uniref:hypothetical protein n=1 Tax=Bacillaceae TaxID=186817 RepID=UPI001293E5EF|nr:MULTISPECIES: hypothetical protein [Bacillaceae]MCP1094303.1 hypothetical protein [Bacillaceae bacterium OS4b]MBD8590095.1 hypothetical protein [Peribacillus simplex]MCF7622388.1 hypothetical protein [Peribacillus frigoritolerans]MCP1152959.1 hypothetical protein [Peribacillus frigoritolerans]MEA3576158.1 hypothetical protein [Peribacillus frigoritolerans]
MKETDAYHGKTVIKQKMESLAFPKYSLSAQSLRLKNESANNESGDYSAKPKLFL